MALKDLLRTLIGGDAEPATGPGAFSAVADSEGVNFVAPDHAVEGLRAGAGSPATKLQWIVLRMLEETGLAESLPNGFWVGQEDVAGLDDEQAGILALPPRYPFSFAARISGRSGHSAFSVDLIADTPDGPAPFERKGPLLQLGSKEAYRLAPAELMGLQAWEHHRGLAPEDRGESANLRLMAELQTAARSGMRIDLGHFDRLELVVPQGVGVTGARMPDGSLLLSPSLGDGSTPDELQKRWPQLDMDADGGVLRIDHRIVLLDAQRMDAIREVFSNRRIPPDRVQEFLETPSAFLDAALVDLDVGFSVRVAGVGQLRHLSFGELDGAGEDWFGVSEVPAAPEILEQLLRSPEELEAFRTAAEAAWGQGAEVVTFRGETVDIADRDQTRRILEKLGSTLGREGPADFDDGTTTEPSQAPTRSTVSVVLRDAEEIREELLELARTTAPRWPVGWSVYARSPFPHQKEGIDWMLGLVEAALDGDPEDLYRPQGALLADDMGLGKTFMALVGAGEYLRWLVEAGATPKPMLIVAPLSLLENWEDEVAKTFVDSPFRDVVVLQAGRDLRRFRVQGAERESVQLQASEDSEEQAVPAIRYALTIGPGAGARRLDMDRRLVLTTYQTLRDYQFSLCSVDWGLAVFDEAQNIKNPNTLQTRAAKGLKADFKLLATGTPVENSLADFWCLFDTAQPGLLGDWSTFRDRWIAPILAVGEEDRGRVRRKLGQELREAVGTFMLRRVKEDQLEGLPRKFIRTGVPAAQSGEVLHESSLAATMGGEQLAAYDEVLAGYRSRRHSEDMRGQALAVLQALREVSLHPRLRQETELLAGDASAARRRMAESAKLQAVLNTLDRIRAQREKVILFMVSKRLQRALKLWLDEIYGLDIAIINGDTAAVARSKDVRTRKQLIVAFEAVDGFNVLIMSPIAAGVGLTVVGANHAIHLERHWNPAKEAQASDRIYRIGQTRDVHIHLPIALHPKIDSFDVHLDRLLCGKLMLKDAVVTPDMVRDDEFISSMGL